MPVPAFRAVTSLAGAQAAAAEIGFPVVVKPTTGSGSTGVRLCSGPLELTEAVTGLLDTPVDERGRPVPALVLVEQYAGGAEFSVETFDDFVVGVVAKHLGPHPYFVERGHDFPAPSAPPELAQTALRAVGGPGSAGAPPTPNCATTGAPPSRSR